MNIWGSYHHPPSRVTFKGLDMSFDFGSKADLTLVKPVLTDSLKRRAL